MKHASGLWKIIMVMALPVVIVLCLKGIGFADRDVIIYTPNGTPVPAIIKENVESLPSILVENNIERNERPESQFIGDSTQHFNCHGYAWHLSEGGVPVFLTDIASYWTDGSYLPYTSVPIDTSKADKAAYNGTAHSVITTPQNAWLISKLGGRALMRHTNYDNYTSARFTYYRGARQPRVNPFAVTYGGSGAETAASMSFTVDGGVIVAGTTTSFGASNQDGWLLKLDQHGELPFPNNTTTWMAGGWQKRYGGTGSDFVTAVVQAYDYGYVAAGYTTSVSGNEDGWLFHLDQNGGRGTCNYTSGGCWQKVYNSSHNANDRFMALARWSAYNVGSSTYTDGYIAAGRTNLGGLNGYDAWVQKVDRTGVPIWQNAYGGTANEMAYVIRPLDADGDSTTNDGYIVGGAILAETGYDLLFFMLNDAGAVIGTPRRYGGSANEYAYAVQQTDDDGDGVQDDGFIVAASTNSFGAGVSDAWILKLHADGSVAWQRTYGGSADDYAKAIFQTADRGYVVAGYTSSFGATSEDAWVFKLNQSGTVVWANRYGGDSSDQALSADQTVDGSILVAGQTTSYGAGGWDALLLRLAADGSSLDCPPGTSVMAQMQVNMPGYSSPAVTMPGGDASIVSSSPPLSSAETTSQPASICPEQHSYLLWTK